MQSAKRRAQREKRKMMNEKISLRFSLCALRSELICPVCDRRFDESDDGVAMPFCSSRCKRIDAARWLGERYGLPVEKLAEDNFPEESEHGE